MILQKLESGEIKVEKKTEFKYDSSTNGFYCIPHHETTESKEIKEKALKSFREIVENCDYKCNRCKGNLLGVGVCGSKSFHTVCIGSSPHDTESICCRCNGCEVVSSNEQRQI